VTEWSLQKLLAGMHDAILHRLTKTRETLVHAPTKGEASQHIWLDLLGEYLPKRYKATSAHVVDSKGNVSDQIDVVIFDRQYTPFLLVMEEQKFVPAESVYAVFEAKQTANLVNVTYAQDKAATVRQLHRTSLLIPSAGGPLPPKELFPIVAGLLTFESEWSPPVGEALKNALSAADQDRSLDVGCIAAHGCFFRHADGYELKPTTKAATVFLLRLIALLQARGTVPMIDMDAYAKWLAE
jgi:uncharacterized protein DUF6602